MEQKFEVRQSLIEGQGIFTTALIKQGETILKFSGPIISLEQVLQKYPDDFGCPLQIGSSMYIDIHEPGVLANHSCSPNAGIINDHFLIAIKDIFPGDEICYDYSATMDEDDWTMECRCRNQNCRGVVRDFKTLPNDLQKKYLDLNIVQHFIQKQYVLTNTSVII